MTTELSSQESPVFVSEIRPNVGIQSSEGYLKQETKLHRSSSYSNDFSQSSDQELTDKISFWLYLTITIIIGVLIIIIGGSASGDSNKAYLNIVKCKISFNILIATVLPLTLLFALIGNHGFTKLKGNSKTNFNIIFSLAVLSFFLWSFFLYLKRQPRTGLILLVLTIILIISNFSMVYCSNGESSILLFYLLTIVILIFLFIKTFQITNLFEKEIVTEKW